MNNEFRKYAKQHLGIHDKLIGGYQGFTNEMPMVTEASVTPTIIEERKLNVAAMSVFDRLMMDRVLWVAGPVDDRMAVIVQAQLLFLSDQDPKKVIKMHIDSPGGSVKSGLSMIDSMELCSSPIETINTGMAASMGSVLLSHGTKGMRSSLINSKMMIHQVSAGSRGHINDMNITSQQTAQYNYILMNMLSDVSNLDFKTLLESHERDVWYNSDEQLKYGFIDEVIKTDGQKSITDRLEGFGEYRDLLVQRAEVKNF
mgnify:CR=1 FL=1